ncbi:DUF4019 domain-containing protein [Lysobacter terrae]
MIDDNSKAGARPVSQELLCQFESSDLEPDALVKAALDVAQQIGTSNAGAVWDQASAITRTNIDRSRFVDAVVIQRGSFGRVTERRWSSINRYVSDGGGQQPPGSYANAVFDVRFASGKDGQELVAFHHDEDGVWRFSGYAMDYSRVPQT